MSRTKSSPPSPQRTYLIMYDIADPKRLRKVHQLCKKYGLPQQYSVFEARLTQRKFITFLREATQIIHQVEDQLVCIPICETCRSQVHALGKSWDFTHDDACIII